MIRTHTYAIWHLEPEVGKLDPAGLELALRTLARHDHIVLTEGMTYVNQTAGWFGLSPSTVKTINPTAKVYSHRTLMAKCRWETDWGLWADPSDLRLLCPLRWAEIEKNDWWLRDGSGKPIHELHLPGYEPGHDTAIWHLDVGKLGFKERYVEALLDRLEGRGFDGVSFDYPWPGIYDCIIKPQNLTMPMPYHTDDEWFAFAWGPFFSYVMTAVRAAGYLTHVNNAGEYDPAYAGRDWTVFPPRDWNERKQWQRSLVDGVHYEQFAYNWYPAPVLPSETIARRIANTPGDPLAVTIGDHLRSDDPDYDRKHRVSLAMYYLSLPSDPVEVERFAYGNEFNNAAHWQPVWGLDIGDPVGPSIRHGSAYRWSRHFAQGIVVLNYTGNSWWFAKGMSLPAYSAAIVRCG